MAMVTPIRPAVLGAGRAEGDRLEELLHMLAGSLSAVLAYLSAERGASPSRLEPEEDDLREAVTRARRGLGLTKREAEVLTLLGRGLTNREIAAELVISIKTAEHHVAHILRKLRTPNRREAGAIARRLAAPRPAALHVLEQAATA
jgi:DNA-binding NarL/FixJ family response regulator